MIIKCESPTRVDLAGGTLDCWPLYLFVGDCVTINLSIDIITGAELKPFDDASVEIDIRDLNYKKTFENLKSCLSSPDKELALIKEHLDYWQPSKGFSLKTYSQSPVGGGLGGSSSLCISLIKAFSKWLGKDLSLDEMVTVASNIEAKILRTPTGTQDYVPAIEPGLNMITYSVEGMSVKSLPFPEEKFADQMLLVNTGVAHHSGINNWQVIKSIIEGDKKTLDHLKEIAVISSDLKDICLNSRWEELPGIFDREYAVRTQLSPAFTCPEIEKLKEVVLQAGAQAVKICGAGGGGCVLVWLGAGNREEVKQACQENGFQVLKANPVSSEKSLPPES